MLCLVKRYLFDNPDLSNNAPSDLSPVVDAYEHALLARYPRPRYMVGRGTFFIALIAALPESIGDWMFKKLVRL